MKFLLKKINYLPAINACHSKKFSSLIGPASTPSGGFNVNCLYSVIRRRIADKDILDSKCAIFHKVKQANTLKLGVMVKRQKQIQVILLGVEMVMEIYLEKNE